MQVILKKNMSRLGEIGDIVNVADGYARNFLLPMGVAEISTPQKIAEINRLKEKQKAEEEREKAEVQIVSEKLAQTSCTITAPAGEEDKLYGAITSADISNALAAEGINIAKKKIILDEPIKKLGIYNIEVKVAPEVVSTFKLWIVKE